MYRKNFNCFKKKNILCGSHLIENDKKKISKIKKKGFSFIAYSTKLCLNSTTQFRFLNHISFKYIF